MTSTTSAAEAVLGVASFRVYIWHQLLFEVWIGYGAYQFENIFPSHYGSLVFIIYHRVFGPGWRRDYEKSSVDVPAKYRCLSLEIATSTAQRFLLNIVTSKRNPIIELFSMAKQISASLYSTTVGERQRHKRVGHYI
jgi:hypothetical protein